MMAAPGTPTTVNHFSAGAVERKELFCGNRHECEFTPEGQKLEPMRPPRLQGRSAARRGQSRLEKPLLIPPRGALRGGGRSSYPGGMGASAPISVPKGIFLQFILVCTREIMRVTPSLPRRGRCSPGGEAFRAASARMAPYPANEASRSGFHQSRKRVNHRK